jgi:hypothetical protein
MKHVHIYIAAFALLLQSAFAIPGTPTVKVIAVIVPGATATESTLTTGSPTAALAVSGCNLLQNFGTAMSFQFLVGNTPIEVSNFGFDSASFSLVRYRASTTTTTTPLSNLAYGAYNYGGTSFPWMVARNASDVQVSASGQIVGTTLQAVSKFMMLQQNIAFNGTTRPVMTTIGDYYEFQWNLVGHYTYLGTTYSLPATLNPLKVKIQVFPNLPSFNNSGSPSTWSTIALYSSTDLNSWFPVPAVTIVSPLPTSPSSLIALANGKTIPGIDPIVQSQKLFLRWQQPQATVIPN